MIDRLYTQLNIDAARWLTEFHQTVKKVVEERIGTEWRVARIEEKSTTRYGYTLATRDSPHPDYIQSQAEATFEITMIENKPREQVVDGARVTIRLSEMHITAELVSSGKLYITGMKVSTPV